MLLSASPLTGENFRQFLAARFAEENFAFLVEARRYKERLAKEGATAEAHKAVDDIIAKFIAVTLALSHSRTLRPGSLI